MRELASLEPGDIVACPSCDTQIMKCNIKPEIGSATYARCFDYFRDIMSKPPGCPDCSDSWGKGDGRGNIKAVHVRGKGWSI